MVFDWIEFIGCGWKGEKKYGDGFCSNIELMLVYFFLKGSENILIFVGYIIFMVILKG